MKGKRPESNNMSFRFFVRFKGDTLRGARNQQVNTYLLKNFSLFHGLERLPTT